MDEKLPCEKESTSLVISGKSYRNMRNLRTICTCSKYAKFEPFENFLLGISFTIHLYKPYMYSTYTSGQNFADLESFAKLFQRKFWRYDLGILSSTHSRNYFNETLKTSYPRYFRPAKCSYRINRNFFVFVANNYKFKKQNKTRQDKAGTRPNTAKPETGRKISSKRFILPKWQTSMMRRWKHPHRKYMHIWQNSISEKFTAVA